MKITMTPREKKKAIWFGVSAVGCMLMEFVMIYTVGFEVSALATMATLGFVLLCIGLIAAVEA